MISEIRIQNFKSIEDLTLKPGRVTVLIGENGSGKSNILESIAFAAAAAANKLDNSFLFNRGIRVTEDTWMQCAFPKEESDQGVKGAQPGIRMTVKGGENDPLFECAVSSSIRDADGSFERWVVRAPISEGELDKALWDKEISQKVEERLEYLKLGKSTATEKLKEPHDILREIFASLELSSRKTQLLLTHATTLGLADFVIYAPENTMLRTPPPEGALEPVGMRGEGLFKLLQSFADPKFAERLADLKECLHLFGWFDDFLPPDDIGTAQARLQIRDRWLAPERAIFDQRSANEGFLYVLFYLTLLTSWRTPKFFAIDNVDSALNPKLCSSLMRKIAELAKKYDKQVICTTHNPAILDGLNINDDEQRLYTVQRDSDGRSTLNRVRPPKAQPGKPPMKLSAAFVAGNIGGLPDYF